MSDSKPLTAVNIFSVSYSGSTWLNMLLGSHPSIFSIGEIKAILRFNRPFCSFHGENCPLWSQFVYPGGDNSFRQIQQMTGLDILVANNSRKLLHEERETGIRPRFIHLIRDGRAVTASYLRKHPCDTVWTAARRWAHDVRRNKRLMRRQPKADVTTVHYERLVDDTETEMRRLCAWLQIDFDPRQLEYWKHIDHLLGGNKGTLTLVAEAQGLTKLPPTPAQKADHDPNRPAWDTSFYRGADPSQFRDDRWKKQLTTGQCRIFAIAAGWLNRRLGYGALLDTSGRN